MVYSTKDARSTDDPRMTFDLFLATSNLYPCTFVWKRCLKIIFSAWSYQPAYPHSLELGSLELTSLHTHTAWCLAALSYKPEYPHSLELGSLELPAGIQAHSLSRLDKPLNTEWTLDQMVAMAFFKCSIVPMCICL